MAASAELPPRFNWPVSIVLALVLGFVCAAIAHVLGFLVGKLTHGMLVNPGGSNINAIRPTVTWAWLATLALLACLPLAGVGVTLRWPAVRLAGVLLASVVLLCILLPLIARRFDHRGMSDDLIGIYLLLNLAITTIFWLTRLRQSAGPFARGFPVILPVSPTSPQ